MVKTYLQFVGVVLDEDWAHKSIFRNSAGEWVALLQVGRSVVILHCENHPSESLCPGGSLAPKWVACPPDAVQNYETLHTAFKNLTSASNFTNPISALRIGEPRTPWTASGSATSMRSMISPSRVISFAMNSLSKLELQRIWFAEGNRNHILVSANQFLLNHTTILDYLTPRSMYI